jgi:YD repeat-containing protein
VIDAAGVRHETSYGPDGTVTAVTLAGGTPASLTWTYAFDARRRRVGLSDPRGQVMRVVRDGLGRPMRLEAADRWMELSYDAAGRMYRATESSGMVTGFAFGPNGMVSRRTLDATAVDLSSTRSGLGQLEIELEYDGCGRLTSADDGVTPVTRRYDSRGLLLREQTGGSAISWAYDDAGRALRFTFPSGRQLGFERAANGGLERLVDKVL